MRLGTGVTNVVGHSTPSEPKRQRTDRTPKRKRSRERNGWPKVLECGSPLPLFLSLAPPYMLG